MNSEFVGSAIGTCGRCQKRVVGAVEHIEYSGMYGWECPNCGHVEEPEHVEDLIKMAAISSIDRIDELDEVSNR